jgi:hypothetical protein
MRPNSQRRPAYSERDLLHAFLRNDFYTFVQKVFETVVPGGHLLPELVGRSRRPRA